MTPFELEQRRLQRQIMAFNAARLARKKLGQAIGTPGDLDGIRMAALAAVAETRAAMHLLQLKGIATEREVQDALDFGYKNLLAQIEAAGGPRVEEVG